MWVKRQGRPLSERSGGSDGKRHAKEDSREGKGREGGWGGTRLGALVARKKKERNDADRCSSLV